MAPRVGLEPTTYRLTADCSAIELPRITHMYYVIKKIFLVKYFFNLFLLRNIKCTIDKFYVLW